LLGPLLGLLLGTLLGPLLGTLLGPLLGTLLGPLLGPLLGTLLGPLLGTLLGTLLGPLLGPLLRPLLGTPFPQPSPNYRRPPSIWSSACALSPPEPHNEDRMLLLFLWMKIRAPPASFPAFDLPVDQERDAGFDRSPATTTPPGCLAWVWLTVA
jgi:hypothetical protein